MRHGVAVRVGGVGVLVTLLTGGGVSVTVLAGGVSVLVDVLVIVLVAMGMSEAGA